MRRRRKTNSKTSSIALKNSAVPKVELTVLCAYADCKQLSIHRPQSYEFLLFNTFIYILFLI